MPFAPYEIENKKFTIAMRGYQTDEVDGFLRAIAADYRALQEQQALAQEQSFLDKAANESTGRWMADIERIMTSTRETAEREAAELRVAAAAEVAAIREAAEREAAELREATQREAEACFEEITRQAEELHRLETALWNRVHALEHVVVEARQTLTHVSDLYPIEKPANNGVGYGEAPKTGVTTNGNGAIAAR